MNLAGTAGWLLLCTYTIARNGNVVVEQVDSQSQQRDATNQTQSTGLETNLLSQLETIATNPAVKYLKSVKVSSPLTPSGVPSLDSLESLDSHDFVQGSECRACMSWTSSHELH